MILNARISTAIPCGCVTRFFLDASIKIRKLIKKAAFVFGSNDLHPHKTKSENNKRRGLVTKNLPMTINMIELIFQGIEVGQSRIFFTFLNFEIKNSFALKKIKAPIFSSDSLAPTRLRKVNFK